MPQMSKIAEKQVQAHFDRHSIRSYLNGWIQVTWVNGQTSENCIISIGTARDQSLYKMSGLKQNLRTVWDTYDNSDKLPAYIPLFVRPW